MRNRPNITKRMEKKSAVLTPIKKKILKIIKAPMTMNAQEMPRRKLMTLSNRLRFM